MATNGPLGGMYMRLLGNTRRKLFIVHGWISIVRLSMALFAKCLSHLS